MSFVLRCIWHETCRAFEKFFRGYGVEAAAAQAVIPAAWLRARASRSADFRPCSEADDQGEAVNGSSGGLQTFTGCPKAAFQVWHPSRLIS